MAWLYLVIVSVITTSCTPAISSLNAVELAYQQQVSITKQTPTLDNFIALKQRYIATKRQNNTIALTALDPNLMQIITDDSVTCLEQAKQVLTQHYVNINAHYTAMACAYDLNLLSEAKQAETALNQLLAVIWETGNGDAISHAFQVLNVTEADSFIHLHGLHIIDSTSFMQNGQRYYQFTLQDDDSNTPFPWFFQIIE